MHDAYEQYLLELINRARLDPMAELDRYNAAVAAGQYGGPALSALDAGLTAGSITGAAKQVLAGNAALAAAAAGHSAYMLQTDQFNHSNIGNGTPSSRAQAEGYAGSYVGENIAWSGTTGTVDPLAAIEGHHFGLFYSAGHRANIMLSGYSEIGLGRELGTFTTTRDWNASMLTEVFADIGTNRLLTGVAYADRDDNQFYGIGEGRGSVAVSVGGGGSTTTEAAGGYALQVGAGVQTVTIGRVTVQLVFGNDNVKLDLVSGNRVYASTDLTLVSGADEGRLLGIADLTLTGGKADERLHGNRGDNAIYGGRRDDNLWGHAGDDTLFGGTGNDSLFGGGGRDVLKGGREAGYLDGGDGNDRIVASSGADRLWGGDGADLFVYADGFDHDEVGDFQNGLDRFDFRKHSAMSFADLTISKLGPHAVIRDAAGNSIQVDNAAGQIDATDFLF